MPQWRIRPRFRWCWLRRLAVDKLTVTAPVRSGADDQMLFQETETNHRVDFRPVHNPKTRERQELLPDEPPT